MARYDLFNGDADGICALQQLRLDNPVESKLVTGLKRDINLFSKIAPLAGDEITALDISFDKNRQGVVAALAAGATVFYADHHYAGDIIDDDKLEVHIHTDANTCSSLIVNALLRDRYFAWAVAGAYGDNLYDSAETLAKRMGLENTDRETLKRLGTLMNYNGYGFTLDDLIYHPDELYRLVKPFQNPLDFVQTDDFRRLDEGYQQDFAMTEGLSPMHEQQQGAVFVLPNEAWARRVNGDFSNNLARAHPGRAHAVLVDCGKNCYRVSVRAPLDKKSGADELCRQFEGGGGRQAAAGINELPAADLERFCNLFFESF